MIKALLSFCFTLLWSLPVSVHSQNQLTLQQAIEIAIENNLQLRQARLNVEMAGTDVVMAKGNYLPSLNGFAGQSWSYGRTIDPLTNQFATNTVRSNNFSLNSSVDVFGGFQNYNTLKKSQLDLEAGRADLEKLRNDIVLAVISGYMQVLFTRSINEVRDEQLAITRLQETRIRKLVEAGALASGALFDIEAQVASEEFQQITAENNYRFALLNLRQLLEIPESQPFEIIEPANMGEPKPLDYQPSQIYTKAVENMPEIRSAQLRVQSAGKGLSIARGAQSPRLSFNAGIGSGFSELRKEPVGAPQLNGFDTLGFTTGAEYVLIPNYSYDLQTIPFSSQIEDNLNRSISLNLTVPIINGLAVRTNITRAKISYQNATLNLEIQKRELEKTVEQSYIDALGAYNRYLAAKAANEASIKAFEFMEQRFNLGAANTLEYREAKNRVTQSRAELLQARYEFHFKKGILDFYNSNSITF